MLSGMNDGYWLEWIEIKRNAYGRRHDDVAAFDVLFWLKWNSWKPKYLEQVKIVMFYTQSKMSCVLVFLF